MMGSLQVEETSSYCTVNHRASASKYQLSNMKCPARDSNRQPQRLEARTLTATPPSPPPNMTRVSYDRCECFENTMHAKVNCQKVVMIVKLEYQVNALERDMKRSRGLGRSPVDYSEKI